MKIIIKSKGGPGSGNFNHKGIPGHQGGSAPTSGSSPEDIRQGVLEIHARYDTVLQDIFRQHKELDARIKDKITEKSALESRKRGKTTNAYRQAETELYDLMDAKTNLDTAENDAFDAYIEASHKLMRVDNPVKLDVADYTSEGYDRRRVEKAYGFVNSITSVEPDSGTVYLRDMPNGQRAGYNNNGATIRVTVSDGANSIVHELGHYFEYRVPGAFEKVTEFYNRRTAGQPTQAMITLMPGAGYKFGELTRPDSFMHPYMGKQYEDGHGEILSMGIEMLYKDPGGFAAKDPEYFNFVLGLLHGE